MPAVAAGRGMRLLGRFGEGIEAAGEGAGERDSGTTTRRRRRWG